LPTIFRIVHPHDVGPNGSLRTDQRDPANRSAACPATSRYRAIINLPNHRPPAPPNRGRTIPPPTPVLRAGVDRLYLAETSDAEPALAFDPRWID
jgi:hypothetical protein